MRFVVAAGVACCLAGLVSIVARAEPAADAARVELGADTYDRYCSTCHGEALFNNSGASFDLRRLHGEEHARFVNSVTHGKQAMPAWSGKLTDVQIEALWAYIRANAYDAQ